jgi:DNA-binding CsgD family transcriptional regulator
VSDSLHYSLLHSREFFAISEFLYLLYQIDAERSFREHLINCFDQVFPELKISFDELESHPDCLPESYRGSPELNALLPHIRNARRFAKQWRPEETLLSAAPEQYNLTPREAEVATWMQEGKRDKEIAIILGISSRTVEKHVHQVLEKLQVENRCSAISVLNGGGAPWKTAKRSEGCALRRTYGSIDAIAPNL